ncbi:hypothetical protein GCM10010038_02930 [Glutamicibacter protophormiae]|nr:hypothetical protein GCM10010038_02930 [Glutamicibacter protophormiae]
MLFGPGITFNDRARRGALGARPGNSRQVGCGKWFGQRPPGGDNVLAQCGVFGAETVQRWVLDRFRPKTPGRYWSRHAATGAQEPEVQRLRDYGPAGNTVDAPRRELLSTQQIQFHHGMSFLLTTSVP